MTEQPDLGAIALLTEGIEARLARKAELEAMHTQAMATLYTDGEANEAAWDAKRAKVLDYAVELTDIFAHYEDDIAALLARVRALERERDDALATLALLHGGDVGQPY